MAQTIELVARDGHHLGAYLAEPATRARGAVVVLQEVFGVNHHIRAVTDGFAERGWLALAPFLFDRIERGAELGYDDADLARGRRLVNALGWDDPVRDVAAAAKHARQAGAVAVVGFCWGGTLAFLCNTRLKLPAVSYYGGRSTPFLHERPGAPLLLHLGRRDPPIIPPEHVAQIRAELGEAEIHEYDAGHGFACDERKDYDANSAALAHARTQAFLQRHLVAPT